MRPDLEKESNYGESPEQDDLFEHYKMEVDHGQAQIRIDKFLTARMANVTRNRLQVAIDNGNILVNDQPTKANYKVKPGDMIRIVLPYPVRDLELLCEDISLDIIHEDDQLIVVNKPAGLVVHPAYGNYTGTLANALAGHFYPQFIGQALPSEYFKPGLPHRIDKNTSGLLVIAKCEDALNYLAMQFYERTIERNYVALAWGDLKEEKGTITGNVGRNLVNRKVMDVFPDGSHGKYAVTHYEVIERFGYVTLIKLKLETGRTHQIRVHMQHIGHPLFGDFEYGGDKILKGTTSSKYKSFIQNCFELMPYQALHAKSLGFLHPDNSVPQYFEAPLPDNFQQMLEKWRTYTSAVHRGG
ncbi:MAG: RluA family pseudouridine synthase [Bacteroidia bacterium]